MRTAAEAVAFARRYTSYRSQQCLNFTQTVLGAPWSGPYAAWAWQHAQYKHPGDRNPPPGVPCYFLGSQYGHVCLSVGGGRVRSTDWPRAGRSGQTMPVGECAIGDIERAWGRRYAGWAEDLGGQRIPGVGAATPAAVQHPSGGDAVYVHMLHEGVTDSDSVRHVQRRLVALGFGIAAGPTGNWPAGGQTTTAVRAWQRSKNQAPQYATGASLGPRQTALLFQGTGMRILP